MTFLYKRVKTLGVGAQTIHTTAHPIHTSVQPIHTSVQTIHTTVQPLVLYSYTTFIIYIFSPTISYSFYKKYKLEHIIYIVYILYINGPPHIVLGGNVHGYNFNSIGRYIVIIRPEKIV